MIARRLVGWPLLALIGLFYSKIAVAADGPVALDGTCAVCLMKMGKLVEGKTEYSSQYDGKTYLFPSEEQKKMFDAEPPAFVPALGGDCVVCLADMGKRVQGSSKFSVVHDGRLFLFPGKEQLAAFEKDPHRYTEADLALDGACPVCLVRMNEVVRGDPKFVVVHDGLRYLFPGDEQKRMFEANPRDFTPALGGNCTVCRVDMKKDVAGKPEFYAVHLDRLYLFPGQEQLDTFKKDPAKYADADVVKGGRCVVCKTDAGKDVAGKKEFAFDFRGKRYLFPDEKARGAFVANPTKYEVQ